MTAYARDVVDGRIPAGRAHVGACRRHLDDLARGEWAWHPEIALRFRDFCGHLRQSKGQWAGEALALQPWQQFVVGSVLGWLGPDGRRRFRTAYVEVPRGNGKSTLSAALALWCAFFDGEAGAECYCAATKFDQAKIVWDEARRMVERTPALLRRIKVQVRCLSRLDTYSKLEPLGADADTLDGLRPHAVILDELHAHRDRRVVDVMQTALLARRQPLLWEITTAGWDRASVCWEHHRYSEAVATGVAADDRWFSFIASADPGDDWQDPATWRKANPSYGVTVTEEDLAVKARQAAAMLGAQNAFRRLHLDEWTEQSERAINMAVWQRAPAPPPPEALVGEPCYLGLDLASTRDFCALAMVWPRPDGTYAVSTRYWLPESAARQRAMQMPVDAWRASGRLTVTPGDVTDYRSIRETILALSDRYEVRELAYDPWNATQLALELQDAGLVVVPIRPTFAGLAAATKEFLALVESGRLLHGGDPVLTWMAAQLAVEVDSEGHQRPSRRASADRIDGIVAVILAIDRAMRAPTGGGGVYEERGILWL